MRNPARGKGHEEGSLIECKGVIRLQGFPLEFPEHPPPKKPESACFTVLCFPPTLLTLTGGCPPPHLILEEVNLELLDNKSPGHNKSVSIQKPLLWLSSLPARLLQLRM